MNSLSPEMVAISIWATSILLVSVLYTLRNNKRGASSGILFSQQSKSAKQRGGKACGNRFLGEPTDILQAHGTKDHSHDLGVCGLPRETHDTGRNRDQSRGTTEMDKKVLRGSAQFQSHKGATSTMSDALSTQQTAPARSLGLLQATPGLEAVAASVPAGDSTGQTSASPIQDAPEVMLRNRRCYRRQAVLSPVFVNLGADNGSILFDASEAGVAVDLLGPAKDAKVDTLAFELPHTSNRIESTCEIVWKNESANRVGLRFVDLPDSTRQQIKEWLTLKTLAAGAPEVILPQLQATETREPESSSERRVEHATLTPAGTAGAVGKESLPAAAACANVAQPSEASLATPPATPPEPACKPESSHVVHTGLSSLLSQPEEAARPEVEEIAPSFLAGHCATQIIAPPIQDAPEEEVPQSLLGRCAEGEPPQPSFLAFYGLREQPFGVTPDPAYLYLSQVHREALRSLSCGIQNDRGFMALIAESGMGKTTLLNKLMEELSDSARTVFLFQTQCDSRECFRYLLSELGVEDGGMNLVAMHKKLNEILFQEMLEGRRFVLIVDEAQNLDDSVLETIRLLSDFETPHAKLLEIVLAGQPQLATKLTRPSLSQLCQRIAIVTNLEPLSATETTRYVEHRLRVAGYSGGLLFAPDALTLIGDRSQGIPRNINNICFNALALAYSDRRKTIDSDIVQKAMASLNLESFVRRPHQPRVTIEPVPAAAAHSSPQLTCHSLATLAGQGQPDRGRSNGAKSMASITLNGKVTGLVRSRHWDKEKEFRIEVSLEREPSSRIPVADRYYCCSFYADEEEATTFRVGQQIKITIAQTEALAGATDGTKWGFTDRTSS